MTVDIYLGAIRLIFNQNEINLNDVIYICSPTNDVILALRFIEEAYHYIDEDNKMNLIIYLEKEQFF